MSSAPPWQRLASVVPSVPVSRTYTSNVPFVSLVDRFVALVRNAILVPLAEIDASAEVPLAFTPPPWLARNVTGVPLKSWT